MAVFNNYILMKVNLKAVGYGRFHAAKKYVEDVKEYLGMAGISCVYRMVLGEKYTFKLYFPDRNMEVSPYDILQDLRVEFDLEWLNFELNIADFDGNSGSDLEGKNGGEWWKN